MLRTGSGRVETVASAPDIWDNFGAQHVSAWSVSLLFGLLNAEVQRLWGC